MTADPHTAALVVVAAGALILAALAKWWLQRDAQAQRELRDGLHNRDRGDK